MPVGSSRGACSGRGVRFSPISTISPSPAPSSLAMTGAFARSAVLRSLAPGAVLDERRVWDSQWTCRSSTRTRSSRSTPRSSSFLASLISNWGRLRCWSLTSILAAWACSSSSSCPRCRPAPRCRARKGSLARGPRARRARRGGHRAAALLGYAIGNLGSFGTTPVPRRRWSARRCHGLGRLAGIPGEGGKFQLGVGNGDRHRRGSRGCAGPASCAEPQHSRGGSAEPTRPTATPTPEA